MSIQCGEAIARRRKEDGRVGSASRGMVRRWGRFFSRVCPRVSQSWRGGLIGATPRGQPWTSAVLLPPGRNGLSAWRMTVLSTFRGPSLCRHVHRELLRSVLLDLTPRIAATACHQRNYVERDSRSIESMPLTQVTLEAGIWCTQNEAFRGYMPRAPHAVCHADQESRNRRAGAPMSHV